METPTQAGRGVVSSTDARTPLGSRPPGSRRARKTDCAGWDCRGAHVELDELVACEGNVGEVFVVTEHGDDRVVAFYSWCLARVHSEADPRQWCRRAEPVMNAAEVAWTIKPDADPFSAVRYGLNLTGSTVSLWTRSRC